MSGKFQKHLLAVMLIAACAYPSILLAAFYNSGWRTLTQPNAVTFQSCRWGDEFSWEHETDTGYTIAKSKADGYYYYAILDSTGDYIPSNLKVAIDTPVGIPQHLRRTDPALSEIQEAIDDFDYSCGQQNT